MALAPDGGGGRQTPVSVQGVPPTSLVPPVPIPAEWLSRMDSNVVGWRQPGLAGQVSPSWPLAQSQCLWVRGEQRGEGQVRTGIFGGTGSHPVSVSCNPPASSRPYCLTSYGFPSALSTGSNSSPDTEGPCGLVPCHFLMLISLSCPTEHLV